MEEMTRDQAADRFLEFIIKQGRDGTFNAIRKVLSEGPSGRKPSPDSVARHEWFRGLSVADQAGVMDVVRESVDSAIFGVLAVLDGVSGGNPVQGVTSDFSLYLQTYADTEAHGRDAADVSVKINPADALDDLHDLFRWKVEEGSAADQDPAGQ